MPQFDGPKESTVADDDNCGPPARATVTAASGAADNEIWTTAPGPPSARKVVAGASTTFGAVATATLRSRKASVSTFVAATLRPACSLPALPSMTT